MKDYIRNYSAVFGNFWYNEGIMNIPPAHIITPPILNLLSEIESLRLYTEKRDLHKQVSITLLRNSLLKSSLYSAKIEGNQLSELTLDESNNDTETREIINIMRALEYIDATPIIHIDHSFIRRLHSMIGDHLFSQKGMYRREVSGIFNTVGAVVYMPPPPTQILTLMDSLIAYIHNQNDFPLITAFVSHLVFEKIHPFLDGNGRVGRALIPAILKCKKYTLSFPVTLEEYLDDHREEYYDALMFGMKHAENYLIFMLKAYHEKMKLTIEKLEYQSQKPPAVQELTARQEEIYHIIREHKTATLNLIWRRFLKVPERTLRGDLAKLVEKRLVTKIGNTKGVEYRAK